jgi:DNA polymerase-1
VSGASVGRPEIGPAYRLVTDEAGLQTVAVALDGTALVGIDTETTGLDPRADRVRLLSLSTDAGDEGRFTWLVDCFAVDPAPLWGVLAEKELVGHNLLFDLQFLSPIGFVPAGTVRDTLHLAQLLSAGTTDRNTLALCCERYLGKALDKSEQTSDWSGALSDEQLAYAASDVDVLVPLLKAMSRKIVEAKLETIANIEQRCLPAVFWMAQHGVALDAYRWRVLARDAEHDAEQLRGELDHAAPNRPGTLNGCSPWNWNSTDQVQEVFGLLGIKIEKADEDTLAAIDHPLAQLLRRYRDASKRAGSFGDGWLSHVAADGRVYPTWRQMGAASGRMSCSDPNMQQLPRGDHRRCVVAPAGHVLVKADYSQIELRIAAKISGDKALLDAYRRGDDLHTITAQRVLGIQHVTKQHRQLAKAVNFGLLFGMSAKGFLQYAKSNYGIEMTLADAYRLREAFFRSHPGLAAWHRSIPSAAIDTRTLTGRRRLDVRRFTEKLNTPVQGSGACGLKAALGLLWERRQQCPGAFPVLAVHDEILVEADADKADAAAAWLKQAMLDGMAPLIDPVAVEVEVTIGRTWGGD